MRGRGIIHRRILAALLVAIVVFGAIPGVVAADTRTGGDVRIAEGEVINEDLEVYAGNVVIDGTVNGNVNVFGGNAVVNGQINGDLSLFTGSSVINGEVTGTTGAFGGSVVVGPTAVLGTFESGSGSTVVNGQVTGDARIDSGSIALGETAQVGGNLEYDGELDVADGAVVAGTVTQNPNLQLGDGGTDVPGFGVLPGIFAVYGFLVSFVLGAILLLAFPAFSGRVSAAATTAPLRSGGVGLLTLIGVPILLLVLLITIVGIPLSIAGIFLFALVVWVGTIYGRYAIGSFLLDYAGYSNRFVALFLGLLVVELATRLPFVGGLIEFLVLILGLGALALTAYRTYRGEASPPEPLVEGEADETGDTWVPPT
ncbi:MULTISPECIES: polymer-forming cytoskeletal protein [unclassified Haladaptatus]|uniref:bactofilin family protein n=1 Tax=unclassified Haladaptatus TaxID=2622732 RepID=UPI0023E8A036|nr:MULTISPECIES: polymer-forming cytoskeletal protein [unclassified Haladaptatus]